MPQTYNPQSARYEESLQNCKAVLRCSFGMAEDVAGLVNRTETMSIETLAALRPTRAPWNKGRIVGQKRLLLPKHVWSIRVRLEMADNRRDLALFNMAIDCKLRGCDLVSLRVNDVYAAGRVEERASVSRAKAGWSCNSSRSSAPS